MLLRDYMNEHGLKPAEMAALIVKFAHGSEQLTDEAVRYWALGKRMPKTSWIDAIHAATDGAVTANDLHAACAEYQRPAITTAA